MGMLELAWPAAVLLLVYGVLGGTLAWLIGLRGLWLVAAAPAFATTVITGASIIAGMLGLSWTVIPSLVIAVVIAVAVLAVRAIPRVRASRRRVNDGLRGGAVWTTVALVVAAGVLAVRIGGVIGTPDAISQTFDNVFHLNAVRWILDTGAASPFQIGAMTMHSIAPPFYPSAWHATAALVAELSGASIPVAVNAQTLVIAALVWPAGAMLLARVLGGLSPVVTVTAAVISASLPAFPLLPMDYGVLYPLQLALALVPVALAALAALIGVGSPGVEMARGWWALVLVGILPGMTMAHPEGFVTWMLLAIPLVVILAVRGWRTGRSRVRVASVGALVVAGAVGIVVLKMLRPPLEARQWPIKTDMLGAVRDVLTMDLFYSGALWVLALAVVVGVVWVLVRERTEPALTALAMWAIGAGLYVLVASAPPVLGSVRDALTGPFYNNWPRLVAVFGVAAIPLATLGVARLIQAVARTRPWTRTAPSVRVGAAVAVGALAFAAVPALAYDSAAQSAHAQFAESNTSRLLSTDERALLSRLDDEVPPDAVIAGNPYTGTALAYALTGRDVLLKHILAEATPPMRVVDDELDDAATDPAVCDAVRELGVTHVLDFGSREVHGGKNPMRGLQDLEKSGVARLIDSQGDAKLYTVTACGLG